METQSLPAAALGGASPDLAVGEVFAGRYRIEGLLGAGGYAIVYRAHDLDLGRAVALKVLRQERCSPKAVERLRREVNLARRVTNRHVVRIYDIGSDRDTPYLTMELIEGTTLRRMIELGPQTIEETIQIAVQLLESLSALHGLGIIHRDVKPENVLLQMTSHTEACPKPPLVKLGDLGLARELQAESRSLTGDSLIGTADYLSPEQVAGGSVDHRTDLFSLGVVLFVMLTGRRPFEAGSNLGAIIERLKTRAPDPRSLRPEIPPWLSRVVLRLLEKDPCDRYPDARTVERELRSGRSASLPRTQRQRFTAAAGLLLVAAVAGIASVSVSDPPVFSHLRPSGDVDGIEAVGTGGEVLWSMNVDRGITRASARLRLTPKGPPVLAAVLRRHDELSPLLSRVLSFIEPATGRIIRQVTLPSGASWFAGHTDEYRPASVQVIDLDADGVDELFISYAHVPMSPSYIVLYEPAIDRARVIWASRGHHHVIGHADLDGDRREEILVGGTNNGLGWVSSVGALRILPWIRSGAGVPPVSQLSPDHPQFEEASLLWYAVLRHGTLDEMTRVVADQGRRLLTIHRTRSGSLTLTFDGLSVNPLPARGATVSRRQARNAAFDDFRAGRKLETQGDHRAAYSKFKEAYEAAEGADEMVLADALLMFVARAQSRFDPTSAQRTFEELAGRSDHPAEVHLFAASSFHLAGVLDRAIVWYERGSILQGAQYRTDFVAGLVLAHGEAGRWTAAAEAVERAIQAWSLHQGASHFIFLEYARMRAELPWHLPLHGLGRLPPLERWLLLELVHASRVQSGRADTVDAKPFPGRSAAAYLSAVNDSERGFLDRLDRELAAASSERAGLQSLRGQVLITMGKTDEGRSSIREALDRAQARRDLDEAARLQWRIATERLAQR